MNIPHDLLRQLDDPELDKYATSPLQPKYRAAVVRTGSYSATAREYGVVRSVVHRAMQRLLTAAGRKGYAPEHYQSFPAPPGQTIRGVSTLFDSAGNPTLQWVKTKAEDTPLYEALQAVVEDLDIPRAKRTPPPKKLPPPSLLAVYPLGDVHLGCFAWGKEAGEDFDLDIASQDLQRGVHMLVEATPAAETAIVLPVGDFLHSDNSGNQTTRGTPVDVDTRYAKVLRLGARLMIHAVHEALHRHRKVIVRMVRGNHDKESSLALSLILDAHFASEPRVAVSTSPSPFWYHRHGKVLLGSTHGDTCKIQDLAAVMASDRPKDWGASEHRIWFTGHIHQKRILELPGSVVVETARAFAARDAWHNAQGYRTGRELQSIVFHAEWGEIERHTMGINRCRRGSC